VSTSTERMKIASDSIWYRNQELVLRLEWGLDSVFKLCSLCMERHSHYAHTRPCRRFIIISMSHRVAGFFYPSTSLTSVCITTKLLPNCGLNFGIKIYLTRLLSVTQSCKGKLPKDRQVITHTLPTSSPRPNIHIA